ncbi:TetR/AcrR family transcriptional regulator [Streptomyces sp. TRM 70351]|uniref:TetR/AcrR family transcriptional regulator n=1 Tax=Streptomyces sp. TRM 70351 TaxID=3116552 RepID=UPI002E7C133D|nr:TetR/AcrR family transcriptional regulator [Streptomyces sp. TRM 70351]MEE1927668.1 TetR/AcrR family transcriptional regulator [Streptomyces sp. TRM 70351]
MPSARESLLSAARAALTHQPWTTVRMVEVAAAAGVSRQTLYNEFSSKEGLGTALVKRQMEAFVTGAADEVAAARRSGGDPGVCCAAVAVWMLCRAREEPLVRAALTGCWNSRLPLPDAAAPEELVERLRDGTLAALRAAPLPGAAGEGAADAGPPGTGQVAGGRRPGAGLHRAWETGLRLALSYVIAPPGEPEAPARVADAVTALLTHGPAGDGRPR